MSDERKRTVHRYEVPVPGLSPTPEEIATGLAPPPYTGPDPWDGDTPEFASFGVVALRGSEEEQCIAAAKGDGRKLVKLMVLRSWSEVDDRPLDRGAFEDATLWARLPPMVRDLINDAYGAHNLVPKALSDTFRRSHQIVLRG